MNDRVAHARALFALPVGSAEPCRRSALRAARDAARSLAQLEPGQVALLTGPSGSGKSTAIAMLRRRLSRMGRVVVRPPAHLSRRRPTIEHVGDDLDQALGLLGAAGLAEASLLVRPAGRLSTGQLARLTIAAAMDRCTPGCVLVVDEFAATLDAPTAHSLAHALARWCRRKRITLVACSAREDTLEALAPDLLIVLPLPGDRPSPPVVITRAPAEPCRGTRLARPPIPRPAH
ncbi:MAG: ATP-binding cassette domain-containing protein [Phycisphaerales bacterium]